MCRRTKLSITLWGSYVDQVVNFISKVSQGAVVIVFQFFKIKEYIGNRSLSNSMYATRILINADVEEISQFHEGLLPEDLNTLFKTPVSYSLILTSPIEAAFSGFVLSPVVDQQNSGDGAMICILAHVLQVNKDKGWCYDVCKKCFKKLEPDGEIFYCHKCENLVNTSTKRYKTELMMIDESRTANITVVDHDAFNYLGITANDLAAENMKDVHDCADWPEKLDCFLGKKFVFMVGIKISHWNDFTSLTVQRMTNDPIILDKFSAYRFVQEKLKNKGSDNKADDSQTVEGRRLSFVDVVTSPSTETPGMGKRAVSDLFDDGQSYGDSMLNLDDPLKKIRLD
ncbi:replication protein A 70 kDa DNA-binding subunit A-like [Senna tora]|uniref:Replication protein A 70 kDa DNA-binding subunit A-like n=1 Tax=Senna tora TaxID=362788 RepID=A0A834TL29_9FABA|nr:replication protein A 70 kDa DNA-binding subunit A-like [Senna tora]